MCRRSSPEGGVQPSDVLNLIGWDVKSVDGVLPKLAGEFDASGVRASLAKASVAISGVRGKPGRMDGPRLGKDAVGQQGPPIKTAEVL